MLSKEQIERFLNRECSVEEANSIAKTLKNNPELLADYGTKNDLEELTDEFLAELKGHIWPRIDAFIENREPGINNGTENLLRYQQPKKAKTKVLKPGVWLAAASIAAAFLLGWFLFTKTETTHVTENIAASSITEIFNNGSQNREFGLQDGSCVELHPGAVISFNEKTFLFNRSIQLTGNAQFDVAKKRGAHFTIEKDELLIDVIGTRFLVKTIDDDRKIMVQLFEGRVKIAQRDSMNIPQYSAVFLSPGQTFYFTRATGKTQVTSSVSTNVAPVNAALKTNTGKLNANTSNNWYTFSNQPLSQVFDQLEAVYKQKIVYDKDDVANLYYIGKIERTDSLQRILETIALLNDLSVEYHNGVFYMKRK